MVEPSNDISWPATQSDQEVQVVALDVVVNVPESQVLHVRSVVDVPALAIFSPAEQSDHASHVLAFVVVE